MKSNLYTFTGDDGTTSLVGGERIKKNSDRLEAYGAIDELSSCLGVVASDAGCAPEIKEQLLQIQNELFDLGSYLATHPAEGDKPECAGIAERMSELESWIDSLDEQTPKIRAFVLPGGSEVAAEAHVARTVCRRAERDICRLRDSQYVDPAVLAYVNRLSDYLFIAARYLNHRLGVEEIIWKQRPKG